MDVELIGVHRPLHHHLAEPPGGGDKHHLIKTGFGIDGEHHAGRGQIGTDHPLHPGGKRHPAMIVPLMHAVGNGAIVKQRSKHVLHRDEHGVKALHVKECLLLTGEGSIWHIFRRRRGAHGKRGLSVIGGELGIGITNRIFQFALERRIDDPLTDLCARFR